MRSILSLKNEWERTKYDYFIIVLKNNTTDINLELTNKNLTVQVYKRKKWEGKRKSSRLCFVSQNKNGCVDFIL